MVVGCHDWQFDPVRPEKRPQIIESGNMVRMRMGDQDSINLLQRQWQQLVANVGTAINENGGCFCFNQYRAALTPVAGVLRIAFAPAGMSKCRHTD